MASPQFHGWLATTRNDAQACRTASYDADRIKAVIAIVQEYPHVMGVLTGGLVSPASFEAGRPGGVTSVCPWCSRAVPTTDHLLWECQGEAFRDRPRARPRDALQRRLGWPTGDKRRKDVDRQLLLWVADVRTTILDHRYGGARHRYYCADGDL